LYYEYLRFISFNFLSVAGLRRERFVLSTKRASLRSDNTPIPKAERGIGRSSAGFLQGNLRHRTVCKAWNAGGVLPLRHGVLFFHHAALQYVGGFRPDKFLSSSFEGKNLKGPAGR
jgi:hypothetical protein